MFKFRTFTICNHGVYVKNFNYNYRFMFQNINNVLFDRTLSLKVVIVECKGETQMH